MTSLPSPTLLGHSTAMQRHTQLDQAIRRAWDTLVSPRTGVITDLRPASSDMGQFGLWHYTALLTASSRYTSEQARPQGDLDRGDGAGLTPHEAMIAALGEAVERYAACIYDETTDITWAAYNAIADTAVCPESFVLGSPREYAAFPRLVRFDPKVPIGWTPGINLRTGHEVFVPASFVFADYQYRSKAERLAPGISTGLAAGPTLEWAALRGICECIERDAFTITYLNQLPVPEIDLATVTDPTMQELIRQIARRACCRLRVWSLATDVGLPCILAMLVGDGTTAPAVVCGAACHVSPAQALRKAIIEVLHTWVWIVNYTWPEYRNHVFAPDFQDVISRQNHLGLATQAAYLPHIAWLLAERSCIALNDLPDLSEGSVEDQLERVVQRLAALGHEVILSDLTTEDVAAAGFSVSRAIVPGLQPMLFGPVRLLGGTRLYTVPATLGYTLQPTTEDNLNPVPHPFP